MVPLRMKKKTFRLEMRRVIPILREVKEIQVEEAEGTWSVRLVDDGKPPFRSLKEFRKKQGKLGVSVQDLMREEKERR